ncbi:LacI family DNA-binding transcriptional regulator [Paracoccus sp. (in: a-proteobacteria)]|uniref:LacI family DNA-binding transcriptional regulator n=1 Tax=Paracoccus sp. TaxID=267 RepID=UPI003A8C054F
MGKSGDDDGNGREGVPSRPTIRNIAERAQVSITTASRALNDTGRIGEETRKRVRKAAQELNYRPSSAARALVQRRTFTLGLLTNDRYGRFTLPMLAGVSEALADEDVSIFLCAEEYAPDRLRANIAAMEARGVDGLIVTGKRVDKGVPAELLPQGIPVVFVHSAAALGSHRFIGDDEGGAHAAVCHLAACGRRRIAHVSGPDTFHAARLRADGWRRALEERGLAPFGAALHGPWTEAHGFEAARHLFDRDPADRPDAVFCGNDQIARGLIDSLALMGLNVPDDAAVAGFDNWDVFAEATRPPLTTIDPQLGTLGRAAGGRILDLINGRQVDPGTVSVPGVLVKRKSCGCAP